MILRIGLRQVWRLFCVGNQWKSSQKSPAFFFKSFWRHFGRRWKSARLVPSRLSKSMSERYSCRSRGGTVRLTSAVHRASLHKTRAHCFLVTCKLWQKFPNYSLIILLNRSSPLLLYKRQKSSKWLQSEPFSICNLSFTASMSWPHLLL